MTYRVLDVDTEWPDLKPIFEQRESPMPDPRFGMIIGAFNEAGDIVGFICAQMIFHAEPIVCIDPRAVRGLVRTMEDELKKRMSRVQYFAFVDGQVEEICKAMGMEWVPLNIYRKQVE